jgi:hypothetical protein
VTTTTFALLHLLLPLVWLGWLILARPATYAAWLARVGATLGVIALVSLVVPWLAVPYRFQYVWLAIFVALSVRSWRRVATITEVASDRRFWRRGAAAVLFLASGAAWLMAGLAVTGRLPSDRPAIDLACPLGPGRYLVANGGSRQVVNAHLATAGSEPRFLPWRGQSYGVDLVEVDLLGRRASGLAPQNLAEYRIYGQLVLAPCGGTISAAADDRPDMQPGLRDPDRSRLPGNFVLLQCGDIEVLLAHLQPGSVRVRAGEAVQRGDLLGFVGNSGNTDEPHLHVSAERRYAGMPLVGGDPVWMTIGGRFLVRNDLLVCT